MKKDKFTKQLAWLMPLIVACAAFIFFQWWFPYHLFRREQTMIFMIDSAFIDEYFKNCGWLSSLVGDFLTQLFYYVAIGPLIISIILALLWALVWLCIRKVTKYTVLAYIIATLVTAWEFLRECGDLYNLSSSIAIVGAFAILYLTLLIKNKNLNPIVLTISLALCYWCFGYSWIILAFASAVCSVILRRWISCAIAVLCIVFVPKESVVKAQWWNTPNFEMEHKLAIDSEVYFGNWQKVLDLTKTGQSTKYSSFYYYLINALMHQLPQALTVRMPMDADGILPPMDSKRSSIDLSSLGEAWYQMGDMTAAEHCTIVAMISSSRHTGSRYLKRLAEINLAKGDNEAAMKYLRMLSKTLCHRGWALHHMPQSESESAKSQRIDLGQYIIDADTIRFVNDYPLSLRHLVRGNPDNALAYDYLQCYNLMHKDIKSFIDDLDTTKPLPRLYQEALLIYFSIINASDEEIDQYAIADPVFEDFYEFNQMMPITDGNRAQIANRFGNTYWYFYQITQK